MTKSRSKFKPGDPAITDAEWELLQALWELGPATARQVADRLRPNRGWAYSTVKTLLDRMVGKGLAASRQVGSVWEFRSSLAPTEARRGAWKRFVDAAFGGAMAPALEFIAGEGLSVEERDRLLDLLRKDARHG